VEPEPTTGGGDAEEVGGGDAGPVGLGCVEPVAAVVGGPDVASDGVGLGVGLGVALAVALGVGLAVGLGHGVRVVGVGVAVGDAVVEEVALGHGVDRPGCSPSASLAGQAWAAVHSEPPKVTSRKVVPHATYAASTRPRAWTNQTRRRGALPTMGHSRA
jgi:hypothetical protein